MNKLNLIIALSAGLVFTGCSLTSTGFLNTQKIQVPKLNKQFSYKRIINNGTEAWIAASRNAVGNSTGVYYSADKAVIKFDNGRLVSYATSVPLRDWSESVESLVSWQKIEKDGSQIVTRCIVDYPQNLSDTCEQVILKKTKQPPKQSNYVETDEPIFWVEEMAVESQKQTNKNYYAVSQISRMPIYAQLHIDDFREISWQAWVHK